MYQYRPSPGLTRLSLLIEAAPTGLTHCKGCQKKIGCGEARVAFHRRCASSLFYHVYCYSPAIRARIDMNNVKIVGTEIQEEVEEWVNDWNRQFDLSPASVKSFTEKRIKTETSQQKRILLEAFKYLDAISIVKLVTEVCKEWYHVSWEEELWQVLTRSYFPTWRGKQASRTEFITVWMTCCAHCEKELKNTKRHMVCPITFRPKCLSCFQDPKNRPMRLNWAKNEYYLSKSMIKSLNIPIFTYDNEESIYLYQSADQIIARRREYISEALELISNEPVQFLLQDFLDSLLNISDEKLLKPSRMGYFICQKGPKELIDFILRCKRISRLPALLDKLAKQPNH
jgi:hypothetical protein